MAFQRINTDSQDLQLVQDNIQKALEGTTRKVEKTIVNSRVVFNRTDVSQPFSDGNLIKLEITAGVDNLIPHGLERLPQLWTLVRIDQNTNVWEVSTTQLATPAQPTRSASELYLNLWCTTTCNIIVWVN